MKGENKICHLHIKQQPFSRLRNLKFLWIKEILWEFEQKFFFSFFFPLPAQKDGNTTKFVVQNIFLKAQPHKWLQQQFVSISGTRNYCYQEEEQAAVPILFALKQKREPHHFGVSDFINGRNTQSWTLVMSFWKALSSPLEISTQDCLKLYISVPCTILTQLGSEAVVHVLASSRLNYCNSLLNCYLFSFFTLSAALQSSAARFVIWSALFHYITASPQHLFWHVQQHNWFGYLILCTL